MSHARALGLVLLLFAVAGASAPFSPRQLPYGDCSSEDFTAFAADQLNGPCLAALTTILGEISVNASLDTLDESHAELYETLCEAECGQKVVDFLLECEADSAQHGVALCVERSDGRLCYDVAVEGLGLTDALASECFPYTGGPCSDGCRQAVMAVEGEFGCCVNSFYNGTFDQTILAEEVTDYRVWSACGVDPPTAQCESALQLPAAAMAGATVSWTACAFAAVAVLLMSLHEL